MIYNAKLNLNCIHLSHYSVPFQIVPATLKKPTRPEGRPRPMHTRPEGPRGEGSRDAYRRAPSGMDKTGDAGAGASTVEFVSISVAIIHFSFMLRCKEVITHDTITLLLALIL